MKASCSNLIAGVPEELSVCVSARRYPDAPRYTDASERADPSTEGSESSRDTVTSYWAMLS